MRLLFLALLALLFHAATGLLRADEQNVSYRIIGLSAPERQGDFPRTVAKIPDVALIDYNFDQTTCTLRFTAEKLIPPGPPKKPIDRSPEKLMARLNELLKKASSNTFSLTVPSTIPAEKLTKVEIKVGLLDCKGCRYCVYDAVAHISGVERATVGADTLTAWIDATKTDRPALEDALIKEKVVVPDNPKSMPAWK